MPKTCPQCQNVAADDAGLLPELRRLAERRRHGDPGRSPAASAPTPATATAGGLCSCAAEAG